MRSLLSSLGLSLVIAVAPAHAQQIIGPIAVGGSATGTIASSGQQLWFRITLEAGVPYQFDLEGADTGKGTLPDPFLGLRNSAGSGITSDNDGGEARNARLFYRPASAGLHYLTAEAAPGSSVNLGTFTMSAAVGDDFPDDRDTTAMIAAGESVVGEIEVAGDEDWFATTLGAGLYRFDLEGADTGKGTLSTPTVALYDSDGNRVAEDTGGGVGNNARLFRSTTRTETYYVAVSSASGNGGAAGTYTLSAALIPTETLAVGSSATGSIDASDDEDWFHITLEAGVRYWFELQGTDTGKGTLPDPVLGLRDPDGSTLLAQDDNGGMGNNALLFHVPSVAGGYHLVAAPAAGATGTYTLSAEEAVAPTAHAGPDQDVSEGAVVTLDGAASSPRNELLRYGWRQTGGATVALRDAAARSTTFLAPTQLVNDETLEFALVVTDVRGLSSPVERQLSGQTTNTVVITVRAGANDAPMADAGSDLIAGKGGVVTLRGGAVDPEGEDVTYRWRQTSGTVVVVTGATSETATFLAPQVVETLGFELTVADARGATGVDTMTVEVRDRMDYDVDDDTLIEVATTSQLAAIRHDLGGAGLAGVSSANEAAYRAYLAAFPLFGEIQTCPSTCTGYELSAGLNLSGLNWTPIGGAATTLGERLRNPYSAVFEGNGHVISNLTITRNDRRLYSMGLFGVVSDVGVIRNVGLRNARVSVGNNSLYIGALVGRNEGKVAASYVSGGSVSGDQAVGGLVGSNSGQVVASYADVEVIAGINTGGGLIGAGNAGSVVSASYSIGEKTGIKIGGLIGARAATAAIESSYFDGELSGQSSCCGTNPPSPDNAPKTSSDLFGPTTAAGTLYEGWDKLNVDGVDQRGDGDYNDDGPWDFGTSLDYPVLVFGGATETVAMRRTSQQEAQPEVSLAPTLAGSATVSEGEAASYVVSLPVVMPAGVSARWDWTVGGGEVGVADFVGTTGVVVIASGASSASFSVRVFDDDVAELSEVLVVTLTGARLAGAPARVSVGVPVSVRTTIEASDQMDYDADDDNLIEVATTSQLAAIRYDLGGAGLAGVSSANEAAYRAYRAAFPHYDEMETCPGTCAGYELSADLDLSSVNPAPGPGWTPLGGGVPRAVPGDAYTAVFEGNGHVIRNLRVARDGEWQIGLFGRVGAGGVIRNVGLHNARVEMGGDSLFIGALVGDNEGEVLASYVIGGRVSGNAGVGGLIGGHYAGRLVASYADVEVHADGANVGGLIGEAGGASVVSASYSVGRVTGIYPIGGLIGNRVAGAVVESSYFDRERSRQGGCCGSRASHQLRTPTTAVGTLYEGWDKLNVDRVDQGGDGDFNDDGPWDFGTAFDYPVLVFGGATDTESARRTLQQEAQPEVILAPTLTGSPTVSEGETASYQVSLPEALPAGVSATWNWSVGGEVGTDDFVGATTGDVVIASGAVSASFSLEVRDDTDAESFETMVVALSNARLAVAGVPARGVRLGVPAPVRTVIDPSDGVEKDYDVDGDTLIEVATTSQLAAIRHDLDGAGLAGVSSANEAAYRAYRKAFPFFDEASCPRACTGYELSADLDLSGIADWTPLGGGGTPVAYTAVFEGHGHVISNLRMSGGGVYGTGLFGIVGADGRIRNVGLRNAQVAVGHIYVGALVGRNRGKVAASYVSGGRISGSFRVGGLIGGNDGRLVASYADVEVHASIGQVGGLVGEASVASVVSASYSVGETTGGSRVGGLIGRRVASAGGGQFGVTIIAAVESSYFDKERSLRSSCCGTNAHGLDDVVAKTSSDLILPTTAMGTIYEGWDQLNVDDVDQGGDRDYNDDSPWDFGSAFDYPVLVFGGATDTEVARRTSQQQAQPEVSLTPTFAGSAGVSEGGTASYVVSLPEALPAGVTASWNWAVGGNQVSTDDFVGATSGSVVIASGASSASFSVRVRDDVITELSEVMVVALSDAILTGAPARVSLGVPLPVSTAISPSDGVGRDYDLDDDTLIEVATTSQLSAIRHDLGGAGLAGVSGDANRAVYLAAFPFFEQTQTCPGASCTGYELSADLDLSSIPDWTPIGGGGSDEIPNDDAFPQDYSDCIAQTGDVVDQTGHTRVCWVSEETPPVDYYYTAVFEGNGHVISNLRMDRDGRWWHMGLFGAVNANGIIRNVGLRNARVSLEDGGSSYIGALVGRNEGKVAASYVSGGRISGVFGVGGLIGGHYGSLVASYADVEVQADGRNVGGLVGEVAAASVVSASYSIGETAGGSRVGGLIGGYDIRPLLLNYADVLQSSYFDGQRSGQSSCCGRNPPSPDNTSRTSAELFSPTTAAFTIYEGWEQLNVDDVDQGDDGDLNDDAPWDFGTVFDYPVLVFAGATETMAMRRTSQQQAQGVILVPTLAGSETVSEGGTASYVVSLAGGGLPVATSRVCTTLGCVDMIMPQPLLPGVSAHWDWSVGGGEADAADFVGTTGSVVIPSGAVSASFSVAVRADGVSELSEVMVVTLSNARLTGVPAHVGLGVPLAVRTTIEASDQIDYDDDGDTLIEVATTSQLAAIRYDLGGVGIAGVSGDANRAAYLAAFPFFGDGQTCPSTCTGYELSNDLDLSDVEPAPGAGWTPIGGGVRLEDLPGDVYTAVFEGNGHVISNLRVVRSGRWFLVGLFGRVGADGRVRNVGLRNAQIDLGRDSESAGALVGTNGGKVAASYVSGGRISGGISVGGLIGINGGEVVASYADVEVHAGGANAGGLVGSDSSEGAVTASYSIGRPTGVSANGLIGSRVTGSVVESSYFDKERSGLSSCCGRNSPDPDHTPRLSAELLFPTTAAGTIYAGWDQLNVDDVDQGRDGDYNDDAPWDFGGVFDYPVLVFGGATETEAVRRTSQRQARPEVILTPTLAGSATGQEGGIASYVVRFSGALPAGVSASWNWSVGGGEVDADDFVGTTVGSVVIAAGAASASFVLRVRADGEIEMPEVMVVALSNARLAGAPQGVALGVPLPFRTTIEFNDGTDYDEDDDGLIEVATTSQLAAIRYDLGGAGIAGVSSANKSAYFAAFPLFGAPQTCPSTCTGYELSSDLDLSGLNWTPLGGDSGNPRRGPGLRDADYYSAVFEGNGHVISNLTMTRKGDSYYMGLFGAVSAGGVIRNVGLHNARVELAPFALGGGGDGGDHVGALVGRNEGKVAASYVIGGRVFGVETVGGLVGGNFGVVVASYADVEMYVESGPTGGGLIGGSAVGSVVSASYSVGATTGYIDPSNIARGIPSGLIGSKAIAAVVESSYFDTGRSGQSRCCGNSVPSPDNTPQTSNQLRAPTTAAGTIYAGWDQLNVDDVDQTGGDDLNDDAPWDFGTVFDYPVLVFGGATETMAMRRTSQQEAQPAVILAATLTGSVTVSEGEAASYVVSLPEALPTGASVRWDWVVGGDEVSIADFVGTTGVVVIGSGASSASFSVEVFDDTIPELSEVMVVTLSSAMPTGAPARARLGVPVSVRTTIEASDEIDYDDDNDGLIDVATTSQLAAIRYDLGGAGIAGVVGKANRLAYFAAFPVFDEKQTCPSTCTGYELSADLDLSSVEPAPGPGWTPIGGGGDSLLDNYYTAVFEGNGHVISNLRVARGGRLSHTGLFGAVSAVGTVRNVGLRNAWISLGDHSTNTGALVGRNEGKVVASYVSGGRISGVWAVGGLIGGNYGRLVASYADVEVHTAEGANAGGLVGEAGGASVVSASYSVGKPTGATAGGLIGNRMVGAVVESSYFDRERSGQSDCCGSNVPSPDNTSKTSNQLRAPTTATGTIYAGWSRLNVDGLDQGRDGDFNDDAPWDFGSVFDYPVLVFGGATDTQAARRTSQQQTQPEVDFAPTLTGSTVVAEGGTASYVVRLPGALPAGASARWSWAVGGEVDADDFVGTTAGSVVIAPGAASASFVLRVRADGVIEPPEVLAVTLSSARLTGAPADVRLGVPSTVARTTIAINDPITVAARSATVSEGTTATFTITLRGGGDRAVVVEYEITAVSEGLTHEDLATVNVEGRAASARSVGSLPFAGSVTLNETGTATIAVRVASDQLENEERERFRLRLTGCPNCVTHVAELGTPSFADVNVRDPRSILVDARVVLQGALLAETRRMRSDLAGLLPRRQPYGASPWNYPATTTVPHVGTAAGLAGVTSAIVDWVLVELRTGQSAAAAASSRPLAGGRATGLLLSDGRIAGINEAASVADASLLDGVRFELKPPEGEDLYVLIHHRNHLPVMSSAPVVAATGTDCEADYCVDFRVGQSHGDGQVEMGAGLHAMVAGDLDRNGVIDERDEALIRVYNLTSLGAVGYRAAAAAAHYTVDADLDFDGEVLSADRYFVIENKDRRRTISIQ